ncbi:AP-4 complex subunit [Arachis hypogaea]|nr:AP-4 complex subunit [Arachis hypogaea]
MLPSVNSSSLLLLIAVSITEPLFLPLTLVRNLELDSHFLSSSREHKRSRGAKHTSACESLPPFPSARQYQLLALPVAEFKSVHINRYLLNRIPIVSFGRTCCLLTILSHYPAGLGCHKPITTDFLRLCFVGNAGNIMKEAGPVSMTFDIPIYHALRLQVLQIAKKSKAHNPYRWVRYVTQANSYVAHM